MPQTPSTPSCWKNTSIAFCIALSWSVMIQMGGESDMHDSQASNNHVNISVSSYEINLHLNKIDWPWWLTPTKGVNGMLYLLIRYVVSNLITSLKYLEAALLLGSAQNTLFNRFYSSKSILKKKSLHYTCFFWKFFRIIITYHSPSCNCLVFSIRFLQSFSTNETFSYPPASTII